MAVSDRVSERRHNRERRASAPLQDCRLPVTLLGATSAEKSVIHQPKTERRVAWPAAWRSFLNGFLFPLFASARANQSPHV
jgi:hypothetical protein